jgi:hypothetical protein
MSTSTIGTIFPSVPGSALVKVGIPQAGGFSMEDGLVPVESLTGGILRFDVTFPASEFKNIGTTPLVLIESNRTIIITSANAILTEQTEAFDFGASFVSINTGGEHEQLVESGKRSGTSHFNGLNGGFCFDQNGRGTILGQSNAVISCLDDSLTGDGFVRILGTYYEIDL